MLLAKILIGGAGLATLVAISPATAQTDFSSITRAASDRCAAAVQNRLSLRGYNDFAGGHAVTVTRVERRDDDFMVRGVASSSAVAYGPHGVGAYGTLGQAYVRARPNLSWECEVSHTGRVQDIDIHRR